VYVFWQVRTKDQLERKAMNKDTIEGNWKQLKGHVKERWGKLTEDDLAQASGNSEILAGRIQERYGIAKEEAKKQLEEFMRHKGEPAHAGSPPSKRH
jgi:uncharacterized protein YjbJ (UPF0337 family)